MTKKFGKKAATVMLSATLLGGVFVTVPNALTTTTAQASAKISYSQYMSDINGIKGALAKAPTEVQSDVSNNFPRVDDTDAYNGGSLINYLDMLGYAVDGDSDTKERANDSLTALVGTYNVFKSRLSAGERSQLESLANKISAEIATSSVDTGYYDIETALHGYANSLEDAVENYGNNYDGVAAKPKTPKSYISKLSAKKTSKKYVKVSGSAKLYKSANYAHIKTYKGYRYAKLNSKHNFSKSIYAPKAKTVKVTVGHYAHGHFTAVTSAKSVHVK